jgi:hypothetical protein
VVESLRFIQVIHVNGGFNDGLNLHRLTQVDSLSRAGVIEEFNR